MAKRLVGPRGAGSLRTVDAYEAALKQGAKGEVDTANQIQQSLTRISGILQQERASGADCVEDAVWRLGFTVGGVMLFSAALLIPIRESGVSMRRLADGDKTTLVPFVDKTDEMGEMARTTGEISEHINEITAKTRTAVVALKGVVETVTEADTVVSSIAAAINQQSAATGPIPPSPRPSPSWWNMCR